MPFFVYILHPSKNDKYYIGSCEDITIRLTQHNSGRNKSTHSGMPWVLMHTEQFETRANAVTREMQIKKMKSKKYIEKLVSTTI
ncbi:MAG: GIY-YIG nuclease family protein [Bacteroidetes bacterium]|nr:GIY-YIG nuclease family protein [Bacteroidota bacterium]